MSKMGSWTTLPPARIAVMSALLRPKPESRRGSPIRALRLSALILQPALLGDRSKDEYEAEQHMTAAQSGEVRLATWDEMDLDVAVWTIPAARMKAKRDHRVPLFGRAFEILHDARRRSEC